MQLVLNRVETKSPIRIIPSRRMTDDQFYQFCVANPELRIERNADGEIEIMPPTGAESSFQSGDVFRQLSAWARRDKRGVAFESNGEYLLPSGAARVPGASWVTRDRLNRLSREEKRKFLPLCPEFVIEVMSPSDRLAKCKTKMQAWIDNGAQLGWLIDPDRRAIYIYRPGRDAEKRTGVTKLAGEGPVKGFVLDLTEVFDPDW